MLTKKILFFLLFSFLGFQYATAQLTVENKAIVYYQDGSVFIGHIVEEDALQMKVVVVTLDTITINKAFIKRILRNAENVLLHQGGKFHYTDGNFVSASSGGGLSEDESVELSLILGKRLNTKWSVGVGVAISNHSIWNFNGLWIDNGFIPVFGYGRYYLRDKKVRVFAAASLGYGIASDLGFGGNHSGGVYFQPAIGLHFASRKRARFIITLGQTLQRTKGTQWRWDSLGNEIVFDYKYLFNRTMLKIGIEFK